MGNYHPHGDSSIYEALVRMAQPFAMRMPLVDGSGNFGSVDGDNAAAMRYTECRMSPVASELLTDLATRTVAYKAELRRQPRRTRRPTEPIAEPVAQRRHRDRGRDGHQHSAAQPQRDLQRVAKTTSQNPEIKPYQLVANDADAGTPDFPDRRSNHQHQRRTSRNLSATGQGTIKLRGTAKSDAKSTQRERPANHVDSLRSQQSHPGRTHQRVGVCRQAAVGHRSPRSLDR